MIMPLTIGLDTSFVIGLLDDKDVWHISATQLYDDMLAHGIQIMAFDCVLAEAVSTLARRLYEKRRAADLNMLFARIRAKYPTKSITWLYPETPDLFDSVVALVEASSGELNFNDALIALSCQRRGIRHLASSDADFDHVEWLQRIAKPADMPS